MKRVKLKTEFGASPEMSNVKLVRLLWYRVT